MLDVVGDVTPAFVVNHRKDVVASNRLARDLIIDFDALPYRERNIARFVLLDPAVRDRYENWDEAAETVVAALRLSAGRHRDDRQLNELVGEFLLKVPEFRIWWDAHRVVQCAYGVQRFRHPIVGSLALRYETLTVQADPDQGLVLYTTEDGSSSAEALVLLASWSAPSAPTPTSARTDRQR
ncbi:MmyB family transcriptional regulator [Streptomyces thinghirensis]|uniref:MmyB-like transcription regulator ligand binding domain-containing protein n=1 Tax=Streptomyces thinghirensis TaxID=551547 RepID=A0ABP9T4D7_9ACTN